MSSYRSEKTHKNCSDIGEENCRLNLMMTQRDIKHSTAMFRDDIGVIN